MKNAENEKNGFRRVILGMSGGVDSSAAAILLRRRGYEVCGVTLLLCPDSNANDSGVKDAAAVCAMLGIEHRVVDMRARFAKTVISDFVNEYLCGRTPNPCIVCNKQIKFGAMLEYAEENGFDAVATGHYARIVTDEDGRRRVMKDGSPKDQSYVLWQLDQRQLSRAILPVSGLTKEELRETVRAAGLQFFAKPDSQDICFVPDGNYVGFLENYAGVQPVPGDFVDASGNVIGRHRGAICYTIGQRKGLGGGFAEPMYVNRIEVASNRITLGAEGSQYSSEMTCRDVNIQCGIDKTPKFVQVKARYSARPAEAELTVDAEKNIANVRFTEPQRALTPGQSAVFYDGDVLVGGGIIADTII